jgi:hypothetical protein
VSYLINNEQRRRSYGSYTKKGKRVWVGFVNGLGTDFSLAKDSSGAYKFVPLKNNEVED